MAAINFPASPTLNQIFTPPGGPTYTWNGTAWIAAGSGGGGASLSVGASPPASPTDGALWWESDSGILFVYYNDGNTSQWVEANATMNPGSFYTKTEIDALDRGPMFRSAYSGSGALTTNNWNLLVCPEVEDTHNCYDPVTGRFIPNVAGTYQFNAYMQYSGAITPRLFSSVFLNGTEAFRSMDFLLPATNTVSAVSLAGAIKMNGTTDYAELKTYPIPPSGNATLASCIFNGYLARRA